MQRAEVYDLSKNNVILREVEIADTFLGRFLGLLGRKTLQEDAGLIIRPCNSIHMIGMRFPIDAIFVNQDNRICFILHSMKRMSISPIIREARFVIETPAGLSKKMNIEVGDEIKIMSFE